MTCALCGYPLRRKADGTDICTAPHALHFFKSYEKEKERTEKLRREVHEVVAGIRAIAMGEGWAASGDHAVDMHAIVVICESALKALAPADARAA